MLRLKDVPAPVWYTAGAALALWLVLRKLTPANAANITSGVVNTAGNAAAGVVLGVGDQIGVPRTNPERCAAAMRDRKGLDVATYCPASTTIQYFNPFRR